MARPLSFFNGRVRPQSDWIIPGWLKRGNTGFVIGQPKRACKSWLLTNLAWDLSEGSPIWGITHSKNGPVFQPARPMSVAYFAQEDTEDDLQDRIEIMIKGGRQLNDRLWFIPKNLGLLLDSAAMAIQGELDDVAAYGPLDLIIFDPMRRSHALDENDSGAMARLWQALDVLHRRYNCSTLFSHHIVKPPTAKGNTFDLTSPFAGRGSGDIYAGGDAFINVVPSATRGQPTTYQCEDIHFASKRAQTPTAARLRVKFDTGEVVFEHFL
jgi:RecA-family ATPase